jgi:hypothetical protein
VDIRCDKMLYAFLFCSYKIWQLPIIHKFSLAMAKYQQMKFHLLVEVPRNKCIDYTAIYQMCTIKTSKTFGNRLVFWMLPFFVRFCVFQYFFGVILHRLRLLKWQYSLRNTVDKYIMNLLYHWRYTITLRQIYKYLWYFTQSL